MYTGFWLTGCRGNNAFAYDQRANPKLWVPSLIEGTTADVQIGTHVVIEEIEHGILHRCRGLEHFVYMEHHDIPVYIVDNHNHALFFWYLHNIQSQHGLYCTFRTWIPLLHIDQHTDMNPCDVNLDPDKLNLSLIFDVVQYDCNVGNFIKPALQTGLLDTVVQVNTEGTLLNLSPPATYILDIDLDFWSPEMGIQQYRQTIQKVQALIAGAQLVTLATSPYFLDQKLAINVLKDLFEY